jgi:hypothetical protein
MLIKVTGSNKAVRELITAATWFYAEKLMGKRLINNLELNIKLKRNMFKDENTEGTAIWEDESYRPKEFTIELDCGAKIRNILITLAHEMVHIKQWAKNEMYEYTTPGKVRFMKTKYDMNDLDNWDYPWEIEAFGKQLGLFVRFCEDTGIANRDDMKEEC